MLCKHLAEEGVPFVVDAGRYPLSISVYMDYGDVEKDFKGEEDTGPWLPRWLLIICMY